MPLLEIFCSERAAPATVRDLPALSKLIKKDTSFGWKLRRLCRQSYVLPKSIVASFLVGLSLDPNRIDAAYENFGLSMGPFRLVDLVGLEIGVVVGVVFEMAYADRSSSTNSCMVEMVKNDRKGQKSSAGFYKYKKGT